ncbi:MAG: S49 family peptidase [Alphaproteobacteria bacterium]
MVLKTILDRIDALRPAPPTVAVLPLSGVIGSVGPARRGLNVGALADPIDRAFKLRNLKAVALAINSPGGSPVQSSLIHRRIRALAAEKAVPVIAFAEDVAASGGYWLALAADEIFADENSIVGSIGVIYAGFGLQNLIERVGIERRLHTSGERKSMLDPFRAEKPEDVERLKVLQAEIHESFRTLVRERRRGKLKATEDVLFSGEFWTGRRAQALGLIDGLGDLRSVMRARFGEDVRLRVVKAERGWLRAIMRQETARPAWGEDIIAAVEERLLWSRYGL